MRCLISLITLAFQINAVFSSDRPQYSATNDEIATLEPVYSYSLNVPFVHNSFENEWWDFGGSTLIKVYDYVRLTSERESQKGYLWTKKKFNSKTWMVEIDFKIHGRSPSLYGDGLAFFYVSNRYESGPVFGSKDHFTGLGIFFDTFSNGHHDHSFPYISAMLGDGKTSYDHENDNKATVAGRGCEANIRGSDAPIKARINYFNNNILEMHFTDNGERGWQSCFTISNVTLPDEGYFGISSATGDLYDNHDVYRVMVYKRPKDDNYKGSDAVSSNLHEDLKTGHGANSWSSFFYTWFLRLGGVSVVAALAYYVYVAVNSKSKSSKVF